MQKQFYLCMWGKSIAFLFADAFTALQPDDHVMIIHDYDHSKLVIYFSE